MAYKNTLKGSINKVLFEKIKILNKTKQDRIYSLSYKIKSTKNNKITNNPREMSFEDIYIYTRKFYVKKDYIDRGKLENDLVIFKTLKEDLEISINKDIFLVNCFSILTAVFAVMAAVDNNKPRIFTGKFSLSGLFKMCLIEQKSNSDAFIIIGFYSLLTILLIAFLLGSWASKSYFPNKIKSVNHAIFTLEAIKENLVEVPENFDVEVKKLTGEKAEPRKYSVKVKESLEDKSK